MSVTISEKAARQVARQLEKRGKGIGLRLGVRKAGCSGFAYVVDYADEVAEDDRVFEDHGVKVIVASADIDQLDGVEIDYVREGISEAFRFNNPNAKGTCGCGESFTI